VRRGELYLAAAVLSLPPLVRSLVPSQFDTERYWLTWLGRKILATGTIPRTIGPESPLDAGAPWIPHEWLYGVACAWMQAHEAYWLFALVNAIAAVSLLFVAARICARNDQPPVLSTIVIVLAGVLVASRFSLRAENFTFLALALLLPLLESRWRWFVVLLFGVWANVHAGFALGLLVTVLWAVFYPDRSRSYVLVLACIGATLLTPFGVHLWQLIAWLPHSWIPRHVQEWQSGLDVAPVLTFLLLLPAAFVRMSDLREPSFRFGFTLYVLFVLASVTAVRNLPVAYALGVPLVLPAVTRRLRLTGKELAFGGPVIAVLCCAALISALQIGFPLQREPEFGSYFSHDAYVPVLERMRFGAKIVACDQAFLCNIVLYEGGKTLYDGRTDPFPESRATAAANIPDAAVLLTLDDKSTFAGFRVERLRTLPRLSIWRRASPGLSF